MRKVELLAPAGSFEALQAAVQNGCDAVYLGGTMFGARAFANNFDYEQMAEAIAYAHVYGVRVYVTVNTLLYEDEIEGVIAYVKILQEQDVDALIVQDLGLFTLLHERFPDLELHASTQMHVHNPQGILRLQSMGATRVVVPRETTIEELRDYANLGVDLEVFVQGALCVSYSGQCLMSAMTLSRSGNRGACAQSCRMQYTLEKQEHATFTEVPCEGSYLLSPKDLNTLSQVPELMAAGIASFKIEGRMKRPEYVALMTSLYRKAIDAYEHQLPFVVDEQVQEAMKKVFNRGFTSGHIFHQRGTALMNALRPNHMGIPCGVVEQVSKDRMTLLLQADLHQGDGVRLLKEKEDEGFRVNRMYRNGLLVNGAVTGERIQLEKKGYVEKGSILLKTSDVLQLKELKKSYEGLPRRIPVRATFLLRPQALAQLMLQDDEEHCVYVESTMPAELARTTPLDKQRIMTQLQKTKDTPFDLSDICLEEVSEDATLPIKELNQMRRTALDQLLQLRQTRHEARRFVSPSQDSLTLPPVADTLIVIHTMEQYLACEAMGYPSVYVADNVLYQQLKNAQKPVYLREPRVKKAAYSEEHTMLQEVGGCDRGHCYVSDTSLNVTNSYSAAFAFQQGATIVTLSLEHDAASVKKLVKAFQERYGTTGNFAVQLYGHVELMLSEYCPIQTCLKKTGTKQCGLCRGAVRYALKDLKGHHYPLLTDEDCRVHLLSEEPLRHFDEYEKYRDMGVQSALLIFTIENREQTREVLTQFKEVTHE